MKICVTGGAGFIGRNLVKLLILNNHKVTIIDNLSNSSIGPISDLLNSGVKFVKKDIRDFNAIKEVIRDQEFVIHLAAKTSVRDSIENPKETMDVNVDGTKILLDACLENNIKKFLAVSSAAVYGNIKNSNIIINEKVVPNPISPYAKSKLMMEDLVTEYSTKHQFNGIILRLFNVYGIENPKEFSGVISEFAKRILDEKPLEISGNGNQTRDFISLQDALQALEKSISKILEVKEKVFNIGSGISISINELANIMLSISGKKLNIVHTEPNPNDIIFSNASIDLAKKELGYAPKISLMEGLTQLLSNFS